MSGQALITLLDGEGVWLQFWLQCHQPLIGWPPVPMFSRRSEWLFSRLAKAAPGNGMAAVFQVSVPESVTNAESRYALFGTSANESYWMSQPPVPWSK